MDSTPPPAPGHHGLPPHHNPTLNNSDDEDSDGRSNASGSLSYKERRREAHTMAEQKRRDAIKKGYDYLQELVPSCSGGGAQGGAGGGGGGGAGDQLNHKVSKATVLQKSIEYMQTVQQQKQRQEDELALMKKEVVALQIMRGNYEQLVKAHQAQPLDKEKTFVPSEVKFQAFQLLMDKLFVSFNEQVPMNNFADLSAAVFSWLEERCKPQMLQEAMYDVLSEVRQTYQNLDPELDSQLQQHLADATAAAAAAGGAAAGHHQVLAQMKQDRK